MVKTGVELSEWESVIARAKSSVTSIQKYHKLKLSKTDLIPFTAFDELIAKYNTSIANFKSFSERDAAMMIAVGQNKKKDDDNGQKNFSTARGKR